MKNAVNKMAEGQSQGLWLAYARAHVAKCPQCQAALDALVKYLNTIKQPQPKIETNLDFSKLESAFDKVDESNKKNS